MSSEQKMESGNQHKPPKRSLGRVLRRGSWRWVLLVLLLIPIGYWAYNSWRTAEPKNQVLLNVAEDAKELVRLTTLEDERVVAIEYDESGVGAFGVGHYRVRISFDIEAMETEVSEDTLWVRVPQPQVTILEHEERGFEVVDVWGNDILNRLKGPSLSAEQENRMKAQAMSKLRSELYQDGSVQRAKDQAVEMLHSMLGIVPGVVIIEENAPQKPKGGFYSTDAPF